MIIKIPLEPKPAFISESNLDLGELKTELMVTLHRCEGAPGVYVCNSWIIEESGPKRLHMEVLMGSDFISTVMFERRRAKHSLAEIAMTQYTSKLIGSAI